MEGPKLIGSKSSCAGETVSSSFPTNDTVLGTTISSTNSTPDTNNISAATHQQNPPKKLLHRSSSAEAGAGKVLFSRLDSSPRRASDEGLMQRKKESFLATFPSELQNTPDDIPTKPKRQRAPTITIDTSVAHPDEAEQNSKPQPAKTPSNEGSTEELPHNEAPPETGNHHPSNPSFPRVPVVRRGASSARSPSPPQPELGNSGCSPVEGRTHSNERTPSDGSAHNMRKRFLRRFRDDSESPRRVAKPNGKYTVRNQLERTLFSSWVNVLLFAAPVGIILNYISASSIAIFIVNLLALIPLFGLSALATDELCFRVGETLSTILLSIFSPAPQFIIAIIALVRGNIIFLRSFLIGSLVEPLLFGLGVSFFLGGLRRTEQFFNMAVAQKSSFTLNTAVTSLLIPTFVALSTTEKEVPITEVSRGTAVILISLYVAFVYQNTITTNFDEGSAKVRKSRPQEVMNDDDGRGDFGPGVKISKETRARAQEKEQEAKGDMDETFENMPPDLERNPDENPDEDSEEPSLNIYVALFTFITSTAMIVPCSLCLVNSIAGVATKGHVGTEFIGLIILPLAINIHNNMLAVNVTIKDKTDLALGVILGSCTQMVLFVIPMVNLVGWAISEARISLVFDIFPISILIAAVYITNITTMDGRSSWWTGAQSLGLFIIFSLCAWFFKGHVT